MSSSVDNGVLPLPPRPLVPGPRGGMLAMFRPGESGNRNGVANPIRKLQRMCRELSFPAIQRCGEVVANDQEDPRLWIAATQILLTWGFGKPPDYNPDDDKPSLMVDLARLTPSQLALIRTMIESGAIRPGVVEDTDVDTPTVEAQATSE